MKEPHFLLDEVDRCHFGESPGLPTVKPSVEPPELQGEKSSPKEADEQQDARLTAGLMDGTMRPLRGEADRLGVRDLRGHRLS